MIKAVVKYGLALAVAALGGMAWAEEAPKPTPPEETTEVIIRLKREVLTGRGSGQYLQFDTQSASSCAFIGSYNDPYEDPRIQGYFRSFYGSSRGSVNSGGRYTFSEKSPFGDASTGGLTSLPGGCRLSDAAFVAGRSRIARNDRSLVDAYDLFEADKFPQALGAFKASYKKMGYPEAAVVIGKMYLYGLGTEANTVEAVAWLTKAARARYNTSQNPRFNPQNPDAINPVSDAALTLAKMYLSGFGVEKDPKAARKWFERADATGYVPATKTLGDIHYYGVDTPRDMKKAMKLYNRAAQAGYPPAQYTLGVIYHLGEDEVAVDQKTALGWYNQAAKSNHAGALYALGVAYDRGEGVAADPEKALGFYKEAATRGNADAQNAIGTYFYTGERLEKNLEVARKWFQQAAQSGQVDAMFNLGVMMMRGEGGDADPVKAWAWFSLAERLGHERGAQAVRVVEATLTDAQKTEAAALLAPKA